MALYTGRLRAARRNRGPAEERSRRTDCGQPWSATSTAGPWVSSIPTLRACSVAVERRVGAYHSRTRGLWVKGETSGATQELLKIDLDCDRDALRFTVRQAGARLLPPGHPDLLGRRRWPADPGPPARGRTPQRRTARLLHPAALRGGRPAGGQAHRGGGRTGRGRPRRPRSPTRPPTSSTSPWPPWPGPESAWSRSRPSWPAAGARSRGAGATQSPPPEGPEGPGQGGVAPDQSGLTALQDAASLARPMLADSRGGHRDP